MIWLILFASRLQELLSKSNVHYMSDHSTSKEWINNLEPNYRETSKRTHHISPQELMLLMRKNADSMWFLILHSVVLNKNYR